MHHACVTQSVVAQSSGESEYLSLRSASSDALFITNLFDFFRVSVCPVLASGSSAARSLGQRQGARKRFRHIAVKHLVLQQLLKTKSLKLVKVLGSKSPSDLSTMYHPKETLKKLRLQVGLALTCEEYRGPGELKVFLRSEN